MRWWHQHLGVSARREHDDHHDHVDLHHAVDDRRRVDGAGIVGAELHRVRHAEWLQGVEYGGLRFQVPDAWPVYGLAKDPTRCVRFDQHAVYLGHAGANQDCPAHLVGRTEAVQVEPIDRTSQVTVAAATAPRTINGLSVRLDPNSATSHNLVAAFDSVGVVATVTFRDDAAPAQEILGTFERAS